MATKSTPLLDNLIFLLGFMRLLVIGFGALLVLILLYSNLSLESLEMVTVNGLFPDTQRARFTPAVNPAVPRDAAKAAEVQVREVTAHVFFKGAALEQLTPVYRRAQIPHLVLQIAAAVWCVTLVRRLARNVAAGRAFEESNFLILRRLGFVIIGLSLLTTLADYWYVRTTWQPTSAVVADAFQNLSLDKVPADGAFATGTSSTPDRSPAGVPLEQAVFVRFHFDDLIGGLLILALAEVFRQGIKLQRESELTV